MSQVQWFESAAKHQLELKNALNCGDRSKFLATLNDSSINNIVVYTDHDPIIMSGYISRLRQAIEKWVIN